MPRHSAAFMSYARYDDQHDDGQLTTFRTRLAAEIQVQTGEEFTIFQDRTGIAWGENWRQRIEQTLDAVTLLLVIITPGFFRSPHCRAEAEQFLDRERRLGREDLILPVYYISTPQMEDPSRYAADPLAAALATRQYADWRDLRFEPAGSTAARKAIAQLAVRMRDPFWHSRAAGDPPPAAGQARGRASGPGQQAERERPASAGLPPRYEDQATESETERLRRQLADAEARADRAFREADELRQRVASSRRADTRDVGSAPFWDVLDPTEREVLRSVASVRTFAAGATIMEQGEPADYVLVILGGKASIRVNERGRERELAERSRGQLIGERAALQVSVRSASVVALEMIWALVVQTKDFAAFISANPRILSFVQDQRQARGTHEPEESVSEANREHEGAPAEPLDRRDGRPRKGPADVTARQRRPLNGENCTVILTDVVGFGAAIRTDEDRLVIRQALAAMVQSAVTSDADVHSEDRGDGILLIAPPSIPTASIMKQLLDVIPRELEQHNMNHPEAAQFQLRISVNVGPVVSDLMGVSGEAIIVAARMVEADAFKRSMADQVARLGIIVSSFVYESVVRHDRDKGYTASYVPVAVVVKESRISAWMMLLR